ncbi:MAG TPA: PhoD-like phosphatase N-terminal domain-containing protein, partial [Cyclobacteriaceae bacterium]|nr:PhoD-like phosphatase N-terminal domain-containing protein [Cyclobacteriaceae bacterium]
MSKPYIATLFIVSSIGALLSCSTNQESIPDVYVDPVASLYDASLKPFYHGVASGDPLPDRVIIWTRVTPEKIISSIPVTWEIAETPEFTSVYKSDTLSAKLARDYTVKVDVDGLQPDHVYYYRFKALDGTSIV